MTEILIGPAEFEQEIRKSRFLARAMPVDSEDAARAFIAEIGDPAANHNCWAYRIGPIYRFNDDGEPSGTAGKPILQAIDGQQLDRLCVVVTRWFGGILLGSGGLMRAYGGTAAACLRAAEKRVLVAKVRRRFACGFSDLALVKARLASAEDVDIVAEDYDGDGALLTVDFPEADLARLLAMLRDLSHGRIDIPASDDD